MLTKEIKSLSKSEKLLLINDLWDDISGEMEDSQLSDSQITLLDERWAEFVKNPGPVNC
jgi:putative addiction module component (TIGR02574 family)